MLAEQPDLKGAASLQGPAQSDRAGCTESAHLWMYRARHNIQQLRQSLHLQRQHVQATELLESEMHLQWPR